MEPNNRFAEILHDTGMPIVIEDVLGLATWIRAVNAVRRMPHSMIKGIVVTSQETSRPLIRQAIPLSYIESWVSSFLSTPAIEARLTSLRFHHWDFVQDSYGAIVAATLPPNDESVTGWKIFGNLFESLDSIRNEFFAVCQELPSMATASSSSTLQSSDGTSAGEGKTVASTSRTTSDYTTINIISDDSIRKLGLRAGISQLSIEFTTVIREMLVSFIFSILSESMISADNSCTRPEKGLVLSRDLDDALDGVGCSMAGLGYLGLV